ncbi:MAG: type II/IV secretion system ATPase subunit [Candidatus Diapherotrites archaeon]
MKIGGFEVGPYIVKDKGGKRHLLVDCRDCIYGTSVADDKACRNHVLRILQEVEADLIVLAEVYERVYEEKQTKMLGEIAAVGQKFEVESIWSYSHLGDAKIEGETKFGERHDAIVTIAHELLMFDPLAAYIRLLQETRREKQAYDAEKDSGKHVDVYLKTLLYTKKMLESTELIQRAKEILSKLEEVPETGELYRTFFEAQVKPSFIGSRLLFDEMEKLELLDEYMVKDSPVQIFKHPNKPERLYFINPPEYSLPPDKYFVLSKTREVVATYRPGRTSLSTIAKSRKYFERVYQSTIRDICTGNSIHLEKDEIVELSQIVARYTVGYGVLEILLSDRNLTDIYVDSPIGQKPLYVVHSDYGQCQTNVIYTEDEAGSMVSKMRAMSGRPFDEAHPVLDFDLPDLDTRVAAIGPPLAPDGTAFAFRLHKVTPWTLPQFIDVNFLPPLAAGLISFFIDNQATMLVTGSRGSGKTSLMTALVLEILQNARIIVQEDTLEIPVPYLKNIGFNIQRLKTRSPIGVSKSESEVSPEESLRTALRLGDSALVLGEVRSKEAKVLYEAMRVGAAGNIVMGTIHGDSAYSVWDRVVNDLDVPNTSFKATDIVVVARPIRFSGSLRSHRRVVQITEVKKHWTTDPDQENALLDLMSYNAKKDDLELLEDNLKESELFSKISSFSGLTMEQMWQSIRMNGLAKNYLVEMKNKHNIPMLLEAENSVIANNKLMLIKEDQLEEHGEVDYETALGEWKNWMNAHLLKRLLKVKNLGK